MKRRIITAVLAAFAFLTFTGNTAIAQGAKKKQAVESKAVSTPDAGVAKFKRPENTKEGKAKGRGDVYGPNYSDIVVTNYTGYYIDIYVDGDYRGTIAPYDTKTTWSIPGSTRLYGKANFTDGSYKYWGPVTVRTGYEYDWSLTN